MTRSKHVRLCAMLDPGSPSHKPSMRAAVVRLTLEPLGLWPRMRGKYAARPVATAKPATKPAEFPPLVTQARNLAGAAARFVASGGRLATSEEQARRLAICTGTDTTPACDKFAPSASGGRCRLCGCRLSGVMSKTSLASEHCPIKKW